MARLYPRKKSKKIANQLEFDFALDKGPISVGNIQMEFDFFNEEHNFYCQLYKNKSKLQIDLLRLFLADRVKKSRKPVKRVLLFKNEQTRKRVAKENRAILKKYKIETTAIE